MKFGIVTMTVWAISSALLRADTPVLQDFSGSVSVSPISQNHTILVEVIAKNTSGGDVAKWKNVMIRHNVEATLVDLSSDLVIGSEAARLRPIKNGDPQRYVIPSDPEAQGGSLKKDEFCAATFVVVLPQAPDGFEHKELTVPSDGKFKLTFSIKAAKTVKLFSDFNFQVRNIEGLQICTVLLPAE